MATLDPLDLTEHPQAAGRPRQQIRGRPGHRRQAEHLTPAGHSLDEQGHSPQARGADRIRPADRRPAEFLA
jgi:hypothetical protein